MYLFFVAIDLVKWFFPGLARSIAVILLAMTQPLHAATLPADLSVEAAKTGEVLVCNDDVAAGALGILWESGQVKSVGLLVDEYFAHELCIFNSYEAGMIDYGMALVQQLRKQGEPVHYFSAKRTQGDPLHFPYPVISREEYEDVVRRAYGN